MKTLLFYLIQVIIASGILYGYYHLMLRNKKFHQYNRFFLLGAAVISVLIPFLNIPVYFAESEIQSSVVLQTLQGISSASPENEVITTVASPVVSAPFNWNIVWYSIYTLAALFFLIRIIISLRKIRAITKNNVAEEFEGIRFINTIEPGTPFSFFHWLFWNKKIELRSEKGEQIFRHEIYHIQQKHSLDILLMELLTAILWVNPFFHLMKKEIKTIHEFLADRFAAHKTEKWEYAELLLMQALNTQQQLVNPFFHNQIKRRIAMITNPQKTSLRYLRKLLVLPVAAIVVALFAFSYKKKQANDKTVDPGKPITIVIDAAHGGTDAGVISADNKYSEAQISLEIAKQIQRLAKEYNINVVMTRENDKFPGNAVDKEDGLKKRVEITNKIKPDAFIAIHVNGAGTSGNNNQVNYSGFEAYVSDKREDVNGRLLASAILNNLSPVYKTSLELKQRKEAGVYVLDHNSYPAILLECGYINNLEDLAFITDKGNQEKIARNILTAVVSYTKNKIKEKTDINGRDTVPDKTGGSKPADEPSKVKNVTLKENKADDNNVIFEKVEIDPSFPGGETAWKKYLERNLYSSVAAHNNAPSGEYTVYIQFVVHSDGHVSDIKALTNHGFEMEEEAIRIINKSPRWIPAVQNGRNVNAYKKQPIDFVVGKDEKVTMIEKWLPEITMVGYISSNPNQRISTPGTIQSLSLTEAGSGEWRKFFERNLDANMPIREGWTAGTYKIKIQFAQNADGTLSEIKALTYRDSKTAENCINILKHIQRILPQKSNDGGQKVYFVQLFTFQIIVEKDAVS
jgi:N-acetylmuramoyl-L-alanine amidase